MKRTLVLTLIVLATLIGFGFHAISYVQAADCKKAEGASKEELQAVIDACSAKVEELGKQRTTLAEQIEYMDSQIYLTELRIQENEVLKVRLQKEIENLGTRIGELDTTLTKVSISATAKIEEMYKRERGNRMLRLLASSSNLPTLIRTAGYLKKTQENDRNLLIKLQDTKVNFGEQKSLREVKEDELNQLNQQLEAYQADLGSQQAEKENLLAVTKNDEATYQQILSAARAQIAGFKSFTASVGGGVIGENALGTGYDGNYYSQRDSRWAYVTMGNSSENIMNVGCLITSVAMVLKSKGVDVTPTSIATNSSYFWSSTAFLNYSVSLPGGYQRASSASGNISVSDIPNKLNEGTPVIVGLYGPNGMHFVVLKKMDGDSWIMFDPVYGPDIPFTDHYSSGSIFSAEIIV